MAGTYNSIYPRLGVKKLRNFENMENSGEGFFVLLLTYTDIYGHRHGFIYQQSVPFYYVLDLQLQSKLIFLSIELDLDCNVVVF